MVDMIVRDARGFVFGLSYSVNTIAEARKEFRKACLRNGVSKLKHIKILEVRQLEDNNGRGTTMPMLQALKQRQQ